MAGGRLVVAKFGGSALGPDGLSIPAIVRRVAELKRDAKVACVFSAPLTADGEAGSPRSITDIMLGLGARAESGRDADMAGIRAAYERIAGTVAPDRRDECRRTVAACLERAASALRAAGEKREFADEVRSVALAFSGELLISQVMNHVLGGLGMRSAHVPFESWPIITDSNIESANFLAAESARRLGPLEELLARNDVVTMGGFIGRTAGGAATTYERGGSDRTAADLGILLHKKYDARIDLEKDSSVVSADPKVVSEGLSDVPSLSYNEARLAGMFGMKIIDPVAIKEILENGVDIPVAVTDMNRPARATVVQRAPPDAGGHPVKIVTGKGNCAIFRAEADAAARLLVSLKKDRRYGEFVTLSPFTRDGTEFTRLLFLDADYVRRNEKYFLGFDSLATITYGRGVVTLIGDRMWRARHVAARSSAKLGQEGINILNMDAQEETSRIIIIMEDSGDAVSRAVRAIHDEKAGMGGGDGPPPRL